MDIKEIILKLEEIAFTKTIPFCYSCYKEAPTGRCQSCHSDDLMRLLPSVGCEYGIERVIESLLEENVAPADISESFEQNIEDSYGETTKVGFLELSTVQILKNSDSVAWALAQSEYENSLMEDGILITLDNGHRSYWASDLEQYITENMTEEAS